VELRMTVHDVDEAKEVAKNSVRIEEEEVDKTIRINDVGLESEIDPDLQSEQSNNRKYHEILAELNKID
jgi:ABC-type nitrate/sulfonate/bicarbonate transport system ATPase subunit